MPVDAAGNYSMNPQIGRSKAAPVDPTPTDDTVTITGSGPFSVNMDGQTTSAPDVQSLMTALEGHYTTGDADLGTGAVSDATGTA